MPKKSKKHWERIQDISTIVPGDIVRTVTRILLSKGRLCVEPSYFVFTINTKMKNEKNLTWIKQLHGGCRTNTRNGVFVLENTYKIVDGRIDGYLIILADEKPSMIRFNSMNLKSPAIAPKDIIASNSYFERLRIKDNGRRFNTTSTT